MSPERDRGRRETVEQPEYVDRTAQRDRPLVESQKSYHTILEQQTSRAEEELARPALALFLSGLTAGLDLGFGPFAMAVSSTLLKDVFPEPVLVLLNANLYSIGFIFVVLAYSALFTEQTTSAVQPILSGRASVHRLFRLWGIVLVANLIGGSLFAAFAAVLGPASGVAEPAALGELARRVVEQPWWVMLLSAIGAGWLMGLLSWLVVAARDTVSQIVFVWLTTMLIGLAALHHSIAGTVEVLMGVFVGQGATMADYGNFLVWAVLGNAVGGVVFVAGLKYAHVEQSSES